tara:strand:- start:637 stop:822 length:186 start_codon:yes stop_codon:yes gene_type:complete
VSKNKDDYSISKSIKNSENHMTYLIDKYGIVSGDHYYINEIQEEGIFRGMIYGQRLSKKKK